MKVIITWACFFLDTVTRVSSFSLNYTGSWRYFVLPRPFLSWRNIANWRQTATNLCFTCDGHGLVQDVCVRGPLRTSVGSIWLANRTSCLICRSQGPCPRLACITILCNKIILLYCLFALRIIMSIAGIIIVQQYFSTLVVVWRVVSPRWVYQHDDNMVATRLKTSIL